MTSKQSYLIRTTLLLLGTGALGAAIALLTARWLILSSANARLSSYAVELLERDEKLARNITDILLAVNGSPTAFCSDEDIAVLRSQLFQSPFMKDIGRIKDGVFYCSALGGRLATPLPMKEPDLVTFNGRRVYFDYPLDIPKGFRAQIVSFGNADVVIRPDVFDEFARPPMYYSGSVVNREQKRRLRTYTNFPGGKVPEDLPQDKATIRDGMMYYHVCSLTRPDCAITGTTLDAIWKPSSLDFILAAIAGAVVGGGFSATVLIVGRRRRSLANQLRRAIRNNRLKVVYQPIVDLKSGRIVAAEALVRWTDDEGISVRPDIFIAIAEERGFIREITRAVVRIVTPDLQAILRSDADFRISINLSVHDLLDTSFLPYVDSELRTHSIPSRNVGFELTERSTAEHEPVVRAIRDFRAKGHTMYIDDFGTGYSSLSYLNELSVDFLKIDRAFTDTIGTSSVTASIVPQILAMAEGLHLKVVVEGLERKEQVEYLAGHEEMLGQGWLFGRPMAIRELIARISQQP